MATYIIFFGGKQSWGATKCRNVNALIAMRSEYTSFLLDAEVEEMLFFAIITKEALSPILRKTISGSET